VITSAPVTWFAVASSKDPARVAEGSRTGALRHLGPYVVVTDRGFAQHEDSVDSDAAAKRGGVAGGVAGSERNNGCGMGEAKLQGQAAGRKRQKCSGFRAHLQILGIGLCTAS
ncbi:hypothetical protein B4Q13_25130, partial [Lacticaseibacillus rhamnosus]